MVLTSKEGVWRRHAQQFDGPRRSFSVLSKSLGDLAIFCPVNYLLFHGAPIWVVAGREIAANRSYVRQFRIVGRGARALLVQR